MKRFVLILVTIVMLLVVGCGPSQLDICLEEIDAKSEVFMDALSVADSTARMNLAGPIGELQTARREMDAIECPSKAQGVQSTYVAAMQHAIDGFLAFMADEPEDDIDMKFDLFFDRWQDALEGHGELLN